MSFFQKLRRFFRHCDTCGKRFNWHLFKQSTSRTYLCLDCAIRAFASSREVSRP